MKICVFSNSHGASLIDAAREYAHLWEGTEFKIFALPKHGIDRFRINDETREFNAQSSEIQDMLKLSSGGDVAAQVDDFDAFLIYGLFFCMPRLDRRISGDVARAAIRDVYANSGAALKAGDLRAVTDKPVFVVPEPFRTRLDVPFARNPDRVEMPMAYADLCAMASETLSAETVKLIFQDADTICDDLVTKSLYATASRRMAANAEEHPDRDTRHMNSAYGKTVLQAVLSMLSPAEAQ